MVTGLLSDQTRERVDTRASTRYGNTAKRILERFPDLLNDYERDTLRSIIGHVEKNKAYRLTVNQAGFVWSLNSSMKKRKGANLNGL